jgi:hypothetical protein
MNRRELKSYGINYLQIALLVCAVFVFNRASSKGLARMRVNQNGYCSSPIKVSVGWSKKCGVPTSFEIREKYAHNKVSKSSISTNGSAMDSTASLIYLLVSQEAAEQKTLKDNYGALVKGDTAKKSITLVFTADEFYDNGVSMLKIWRKEGIKSSSFLERRFLADRQKAHIKKMVIKDRHCLGLHSDEHLRYCYWNDQNHTPFGRDAFFKDLALNYQILMKFGDRKEQLNYFLPSYPGIIKAFWRGRLIVG